MPEPESRRIVQRPCRIPPPTQTSRPSPANNLLQEFFRPFPGAAGRLLHTPPLSPENIPCSCGNASLPQAQYLCSARRTPPASPVKLPPQAPPWTQTPSEPPRKSRSIPDPRGQRNIASAIQGERASRDSFAASDNPAAQFSPDIAPSSPAAGCTRPSRCARSVLHGQTFPPVESRPQRSPAPSSASTPQSRTVRMES